MLAFTRATYAGYQYAEHLYRLGGVLSAVEAGLLKRVLITMPPRHGKSEMCSVRFPAWYLGRNPDKRIIIASYAADLAERFSRQVRAIVCGERYPAIFPGVQLAQDSRSVATWDIAGRRGGLKAVGVGGPLSGFGTNCLLIDDPVKNRAEAQSEVYRNAVYDWYTSTAYTRLEEGGAVIVIMTRWHEDDLMGRILAAEAAGDTTEGWHVLHMPAVDDEGRALWPEKYDSAALDNIRQTIGEYDWNALYLGRPVPREGAMFNVSRVETVNAAPAGLRACRAWDMAATPGGGDFTVGVRMDGPDADGVYYVVNVIRGQWSTDKRNAVIRDAAERDGQDCWQLFPVDPGSAGVDAARAVTRMLAGHRVRSERVTGPKETRAEPYAAAVGEGNIKIVKALWNTSYLAELQSFPMGAHDDQVDASADAYTDLTRKRVARAF